MQFDSQERKPIFYVILFAVLIAAIVFFASSVKKAVNSSKAKTEATTSQSQSADEK